jgi:cold shock CspA family protein
MQGLRLRSALEARGATSIMGSHLPSVQAHPPPAQEAIAKLVHFFCINVWCCIKKKRFFLCRTGAPSNYPSVSWGRVKFYDANKKWGFIVPLDSTNDVFVHEKDLRSRTPSGGAPFLVTGEYVQYTLCEANQDEPRDRAVNVSGLAGGPLLCENGTFTFSSYEKTYEAGKNEA